MYQYYESNLARKPFDFENRFSVDSDDGEYDEKIDGGVERKLKGKKKGEKTGDKKDKKEKELDYDNMTLEDFNKKIEEI